MIYLMSGIPGSGKSTFIKENMTPFDVIISRDAIRFSMLKEGEDYFAHEKDVLKKFRDQIKFYDEDSSIGNIWIDATHISRKVRRKVLNDIFYNQVTCIFFRPNVEKSIENNNKREGIYRVPEYAIREQALRFEIPTIDEGFKYIMEVLY